MKTSLLMLACLGAVSLAGAPTNTEPVALPEMKVSPAWDLVTERVLPEYPVDLRRSGESGCVSLDLAIDSQGRVESVKVLASDNFALTDAAREAARRWRFVPDEKADMREVRHAYVTFHFMLTGETA